MCEVPNAMSGAEEPLHGASCPVNKKSYGYKQVEKKSMSQSKKALIPALRQYQHNDCSGFIVGYDKEETEKIVAGLVDEIESLKISLVISSCPDWDGEEQECMC